jgi:hypothetical protein
VIVNRSGEKSWRLSLVSATLRECPAVFSCCKSVVSPAVVPPLYCLPPPGWRTRLAEIEHLLEAGPLADDLARCRQVGVTVGDLHTEPALRQVVSRYPNLFPGEPGFEVAWAIMCGAPIPRALLSIDPGRYEGTLVQSQNQKYARTSFSAGSRKGAGGSSPNRPFVNLSIS